MLTLAWRNIWRQRIRSLITVLVVAVVVTSTLAYFGLLEAMKNGMFQKLTESSGHVSVRVPSWRDKREFGELLIRDASARRQAVQRAAQDAEVRAVLEVPALLAGEDSSRGVQLLGEDAPQNQRDRFARQYLRQGRLPNPDVLDEVALGEALARTLEIRPGGTVYAFAPGTEGAGAAAYRVVGLLDLPEQSLEGRFAYLSLPAVQALAAPGAVTRFEVYLPEVRRLVDEPEIVPVQTRLEASLGSVLSVEHWRDANPAMASYINLMDPVIIIFDAVFFLLAGLLLVNTVYLSVLERVREFGIIISLGANRWQVMRMVFLESLTLVGVGAAMGFALGLGIVGLLARGFSMPSAESYAEFGLPLVMYGSISLGQIAVTLTFAFATALLAALLPAWRAGRLQPVEAMRFVA
jgi:ABC-type lipoprotein release transport system permease subunit